MIVETLPKRAHPDLNQGLADLQSAALTTELCTQMPSNSLALLGDAFREFGEPVRFAPFPIPRERRMFSKSLLWDSNPRSPAY